MVIRRAHAYAAPSPATRGAKSFYRAMWFLGVIAVPTYIWLARNGAPQLVWTGIVALLGLLLIPAEIVRRTVEDAARAVSRKLATIVPAPSPRPAVRAEEIGALAMLAAACATAATAVRDRARSIKSRVLATTSAITITLHPRLATSIVARHTASSAA